MLNIWDNHTDLTSIQLMAQRSGKTQLSICINLTFSAVLEYVNIAWGPQYVIDQQNIEKVQRRTTKLIQDYTYDDRLVAITNIPEVLWQNNNN